MFSVSWSVHQEFLAECMFMERVSWAHISEMNQVADALHNLLCCGRIQPCADFIHKQCALGPNHHFSGGQPATTLASQSQVQETHRPLRPGLDTLEKSLAQHCHGILTQHMHRLASSQGCQCWPLKETSRVGNCLRNAWSLSFICCPHAALSLLLLRYLSRMLCDISTSVSHRSTICSSF